MPDRPGTGEQPADAYPVAYCAPGGRAAAAILLAMRGEEVARIVEHPWLEGATSIYVVAQDPLDLTRDLPVRSEFHQPVFPSLLRFRDDLLCGARITAFVNRPHVTRLSSVI
jgi:hypothetical protein